MANEAQIRQSIAEVFAADGSTSGSTGLVGLTGKANPIVRWGDRGMNERPIVTYFQPSSRIRRGTFDAMVLNVQFDVWVDGDSTGLEESIADRIEAVLTQPNLASTARTYPVDVAPYLRGRHEVPELDEGRRRLVITYDFWWNRST